MPVAAPGDGRGCGRGPPPRLVAGETVTVIMTEGRGSSNAKAKRELGWQLRYPSWRQGFKAENAVPLGPGIKRT